MRAVAVVGLLCCATGRAAADPVVDAKAVVVPPFVAVASVTATSFLANKKDPARYAPSQAVVSVVDGPPGGEEGPETYSSMWCEGRPDDGVGETLTVTLTQPTRIDAIEVAAGVWKSERLFARNNLPARLDVAVDGGAPQHVEVAPARERVSIAVGKTIRAFAITIAAVKKGAINDTCLSSVSLMRERRALPVLLGLPAPAVTALPDAIRRILAAVASNEAGTLAAVGDFPLPVTTAGNCDGTGNSETSTVTHKNAKAMQRACAAYRKLDPGELPRPSDPCLDDTEIVQLRGGDATVDVVLHSICGYTFNPVYTLVWRGGAWKLSAIGLDQP